MVGLGTVGRWLLDALSRSPEALAARYGIALDLVALGSRSQGLVYREGGLDAEAALEALAAGDPLTSLAGVESWARPREGMGEVGADILVEVSASPADDAEPAADLMRDALGRGEAVVTSNKWPVALHGRELKEIAGSARVPLRCESTVMSGTPVLGALSEGLAGATPVSLRGVLNATANFILCEIESGRSYDEALARAQELGLAENDPGADVDGHDTCAKLMILAALVFGRQLAIDDVERTGISALDTEAVAAARADGFRTRELATLTLEDDGVHARVEPARLALEDPLARLEGTENAAICEAEPIGRVMVAGPGAGTGLAGQGAFSDLINAAGALACG